jgi:hypothetical protein
VKIGVRKKPDLFLCHSSTDKDFVRQIARDLDDLGVIAWFDAWEIEPGDSLLKKIGGAINESAHFGIILTPSSVASRWCEVELVEALSIEISSGSNRIIPILAAKTTLPPFLKGRHYINLDKDYCAGLLRVAGKIFEIPLRDIDTLLSSGTMMTRDTMISFLLNATRDRRVHFGGSDWQLLKTLLKRHNIDIGDDIEIFDFESNTRHSAA